MCYLIVVTLFLFIHCNCIFAEKDSLLIACPVDDMECLSKSTETFLNNTCTGISHYDIRAIDPFTIPSLDILQKNRMINFKEVMVTGLKELKISDFKMDTILMSVLLEIKADLDIIADSVAVVMPLSLKTLSRNFSAKATTLGIFRYNYTIQTDDEGVQHFAVGPESISCEILSDPEITPDPQLAEANDICSIIEGDNMVEPLENYICDTAVVGYENLVHNIRAIAKHVPTSEFFTNF